MTSDKKQSALELTKRSHGIANKHRFVLAIVLVLFVTAVGYEYYQQPQESGTITTTEPANLALMLTEALNWMYIALAILGVLLFALFYIRKESEETATSVTTQSESKPEPQKDRKTPTTYCWKCGAKMPRDSVFCQECGTTVP